MKKIYTSFNILLIALIIMFSSCSNQTLSEFNANENSSHSIKNSHQNDISVGTAQQNIFNEEILQMNIAERKQYLIDQTSILNCNVVVVKYLGESKNNGNIEEFITEDGHILTTTKSSENSVWGSIYGVGYTLEYSRWVANDVGTEVLIYYNGELPADGNLDIAEIKAIIYPGVFYNSTTNTMPDMQQTKDKIALLNSAFSEYIINLESPKILNFEEAIIDMIINSGLGGFSKTETDYNNFYYSNGEYKFCPEDYIIVRDGNEIKYLQFHISVIQNDKYKGKVVYGTDGYTYTSTAVPIEYIKSAMILAPLNNDTLVLENRIDQTIDELSYKNCNILYGDYVSNNAYYKDIVQFRAEDGKLYTFSKWYDYNNLWSHCPGRGNTLMSLPRFTGDETIVILYEGNLPTDGNLDKTKIKYAYGIDRYYMGREISTETIEDVIQYTKDYDNALIEYISSNENQVILSFDDAINAASKDMGIIDLMRYVDKDGYPVYVNDEYMFTTRYLQTLLPGSLTRIDIEFYISVYKNNECIKKYRCLSNGTIYGEYVSN